MVRSHNVPDRAPRVPSGRLPGSGQSQTVR